jgi:hypothetical protein
MRPSVGDFSPSAATSTEAEHVNLAGSPLWVSLLFAVNLIPAAVVDLVFRFLIAPGVLLAFTIYLIVTEEFHWRIHLGDWLPPASVAQGAII